MDSKLFSNSPVGSLQRITGVDARFGIEYDHFAYVPDVLPVEIVPSNTTWKYVVDAEKELSRLDQASRQIPNPELLLRPSIRREAQSTSALEGTYAPLEDVLKQEDIDDNLSEEMREVLNYVGASEYAFDSIRNGRNISAALLEDIHHLLVNGTKSDGPEKGKVRETQVIIGDKNQPIESARFIPMKGGIDLRANLDSLILWISNSELKSFPTIATAMTHYQFETLHPFNDGNGRIGRLLIVLQLMQYGILSVPLLSVSPWFESRKEEYKDELQILSIHGDWDRWIQFFSRALAESALDTRERINRLLVLQEEYVALVKKSGKTGVIRDIVDGIIAMPVFTSSQIANKYKKTPPAVNAALKTLSELGIIRSTDVAYGKTYIATGIIRLLREPLR